MILNQKTSDSDFRAKKTNRKWKTPPPPPKPNSPT